MKTPPEKTPPEKTPRGRRLKQLLRRPLDSPAELERLTADVTRRWLLLRDRGRIALVAAAIFTVMFGIIAASDPGTPESERFMFPAILLLAAAIVTPWVARMGWANPRLLDAQRRLLRDRRISGPELEDPAAVLSDLEQRIDKAEALLARDATAERCPAPRPPRPT